jgi:hypothetical protein
MKICLVGDELFHADERRDGQTDMTKVIVAFRNYVNAPKNRQEHAISRSGAVVPLTLAPEINYFSHSYCVVQLMQMASTINPANEHMFITLFSSPTKMSYPFLVSSVVPIRISFIQSL